MKEAIVLSSAGFIILLNGYIGHHYPPNGITLTPIILGITSLIIALGMKKLSNILKLFLIISGIIFNDYLIRNYSGGIHDSEGFAWITLYLFFGLITSYIIFIAGVFSSKDTLPNKLIVAILFPLVIGLYMGIR